MNSNKIIVVFDLDDTLYPEVEYLTSAYRQIALILSEESGIDSELLYSHMMDRFGRGKEVFQNTIESFQLKREVSDLLQWYREHIPEIVLTPQTRDVLEFVRKRAFKTGLITDGRSVQQRNKIRSLGLEHYFDDVIISEEFGSEKPASRNYTYFTEMYGTGEYWYIGDNTSKDFIAPNGLGWGTICLIGDESNIHPQNFDDNKPGSPDYFVGKLKDILRIIKFP